MSTFPSLQHIRGIRVCWSFRMGARKSDKQFNYSHGPAQTEQQVGWNTFGAQTNHGQTWIHKTHDGPDLGEATTFPLVVYFVPSHGTSIQMSFLSQDSQVRVLKVPKLGLSRLWKTHNFVCKPPIKVRFEAKLYPSLRVLQ